MSVSESILRYLHLRMYEKVGKLYLIDMFYDTSRYLDDIFTIDNFEFEKRIPDIHPMEYKETPTKMYKPFLNQI